MAKMPPVKKSAPTKAAPAKDAPAKSPVKGAAVGAVAGKAPAAGQKVDLKALSALVAESLPLMSPATIEKVVEKTFAAMTEAYARGDIINIKDFGKLEIKRRPERQGRNPKTGETMTIAAKSVPKFTFAKKLKDAV